MARFTLPSNDVHTIVNLAMSLGTHWLPPGHEAQFKESLEEMLDVAFFASLVQEEGRPTRVALAYALREVSFIPGEIEIARPFARPTPLSVRAVKKLAPAIDPWRGFLAVEPVPDGGLEIWGIGLGGRRRHEPLGSRREIVCPLVRVLGVGVISVERVGYTLWIYDRGQSFQPGQVASPLVVYERSELVAGSLLLREASEIATAGR